MKLLSPLLGLALITTTLAQEKSLPANVTLPYDEFRKLLESAKKPEPKAAAFPLAFAIHSAAYEVQLADSATCTATFDIESFREEPTKVRLLGPSAIIERVEPAATPLVRDHDGISLVVARNERLKLAITFRWAAAKAERESLWECAIPQALLSRLRITQLPPETTAAVDGALADSQADTWLLAPSNTLRIRTVVKSTTPLEPALAMPPVIRDSKTSTRVVPDGTYLNAATWTIAHTDPLGWQLRIGRDTQLVSCRVAGRPLAPTRVDPDTIEISLPASAGDSRVELTYTSKTTPFAAVRGDFALSLPTSELLTELIEWTITLPAAYEPIAIEGNCELVPADQKNTLRLRKEISRDEAPQVRVFYQKPETKKP